MAKSLKTKTALVRPEQSSDWTEWTPVDSSQSESVKSGSEDSRTKNCHRLLDIESEVLIVQIV